MITCRAYGWFGNGRHACKRQEGIDRPLCMVQGRKWKAGWRVWFAAVPGVWSGRGGQDRDRRYCSAVVSNAVLAALDRQQVPVHRNPSIQIPNPSTQEPFPDHARIHPSPSHPSILPLSSDPKPDLRPAASPLEQSYYPSQSIEIIISRLTIINMHATLDADHCGPSYM